MPHALETQDLVDTLRVLRKQEETTYKCSGQHLYRQSFFKFSSPVDESCRTKMTSWCNQVIDFCKFNRETVAIAMNYLDRYVQISPETAKDRSTFQLASMTCLYTAIKIHEPQAMEPSTVSTLSRGIYSKEDVLEMERKILFGLKWTMNPPTVLAFARIYLDLLPQELIAKEYMLELAAFQAELATSESWFIGTNPSTIALAALTNAFNLADVPPKHAISYITKIMFYADIECSMSSIIAVEERLYKGLQMSSETLPSGRLSPKLVSKCTSSSTGFGSPRSISIQAHS